MRHEDHVWRLVEAWFGFAVLLVVAALTLLYPVVAGTPSPPPTLPSFVEYVLALPVPATWLVLISALCLSVDGRAYLTGTAGEALAEQNVASKPHNLTIGGLVLAALAVSSRDTLSHPTGSLLVGSLTAFLLAWSMGTGPYRKSSMLASEAMHWSGLAMLLAAVADLAIVDSIPWGQLIAFLAMALLTVYSATVARAYWRSAQPRQVMQHRD